MNTPSPTTGLREASPEEHDSVCARMAAMDPWLRLRIRGGTLLRALQNDAERHVWVYDVGNAIAGCVMFRTARCLELLDERAMCVPPAPPATEPPHLQIGGYVNALTVFPGFQQRGLGWNLLRHAEDVTAQHSDRIYLCVSEVNPRARSFYERHGYLWVGNIEDCIRPGNTEHLMLKMLETH